MKMQIDKRNGVSSGDKKEGDDSKDVADNSSENSMEMAGRPVRNPTRTWKIIGKL